MKLKQRLSFAMPEKMHSILPCEEIWSWQFLQKDSTKTSRNCQKGIDKAEETDYHFSQVSTGWPNECTGVRGSPVGEIFMG